LRAARPLKAKPALAEETAVKLTAFSPEHLRLDATLPFGVRDGSGTLLLQAGARIVTNDQLAYLRSKTLFADEQESAEWRRKLGASMGEMLRQNAPLKAIAAVRPPQSSREGLVTHDSSVPDHWESLAVSLDAALREARPEAEFVARVRHLQERASRLGQRHVDSSLYHLIHTAGHSMEKYSSHHALLVMLVGEQAAMLLGWSHAAVCSLGCAALTMNVAMAGLQDRLADSDLPLTAATRAIIDRHPEQGAALLRDAGVDDVLWCEAVRLHHDRGDAERAWADLPEERRLARLLRRADIFTAKISRRRGRAPMSPVQAAREACLGADGVPDEVGGALLRATGLYPPGSFVELANGERGIVVSRGRRANLPWVASLVASSGMPLGEPALRDTIETRYAVRAAVAAASIKVRPDHQRILALR
jgi:HD-GYP domain-containing protein (c-di-GMP phosphodiesterase class II)